MKRDRSKDPPKSAAELMAELQSDPDYRARQLEKEQHAQQRQEEYRRAARPMLDELAALGFKVRSLGDLRESAQDYRAAVPVLLKWLPTVTSRALKEDIVRSLTVPFARPEAARPLITEFKTSEDHSGTGLRWTIANALAVVADDSVFEEIADLVSDRTFGKAREMLALSLANMRRTEAIPLLIELLRDDVVVGHAVMALGRLRASEARPYVVDLLQHSKGWIREEARKTLGLIG